MCTICSGTEGDKGHSSHYALHQPGACSQRAIRPRPVNTTCGASTHSTNTVSKASWRAHKIRPGRRFSPSAGGTPRPAWGGPRAVRRHCSDLCRKAVWLGEQGWSQQMHLETQGGSSEATQQPYVRQGQEERVA